MSKLTLNIELGITTFHQVTNVIIKLILLASGCPNDLQIEITCYFLYNRF